MDRLSIYLTLMTGAVLAGIAAHLAFGARFLPDAHRGRPGEWLRNELAHLWVGLAFVVGVCAAWKGLTGAFPDREPLLAMAVIAPFAFEACQWRRFGGSLSDALSDAWFMSAGAVAVVLAFQWRGGWAIAGDLRPVLAVWAITSAALARGVFVRWQESRHL
jgi:hypothetical protein